MFVLLCWAASGCAGKRQPGMYERDQLAEFAKAGVRPALVVEEDYILGTGDRIEVVFLYHSNLTTRNLLVRNDGKISLPYVGDQMAAGLMPMELDSILTDRFAEILREPSLSVILHSQGKKTVYVLGEVQRPGGYQYDNRVTLVQVVALAGGLVSGAKPENSVLIRRHGMDKIIGVEVDIKAILRGAQMQNDISLRNYDIIYVPRSRIHSAAELGVTMASIFSVALEPYTTFLQIQSLTKSIEFLKIRSDEESSK